MPQVIRRRSNGTSGRTPTKSQKLIHVADKLGLTGIKEMQGSSLNIVDTVPLVANATRQTLTFFNNCSQKSKNFSNFQNGKLPAGGSFAMEYVTFIYMVLTTA